MPDNNLQNNLSESTSPYLLQHKDNPVHWQLWSNEAFALAKKSNKPILLSIGYAACHWCHVMAHESFEDAAIAKLMNELFINIKLDREERPDLDHFYMSALQMMGEQGGWPMTMFLTHEALPFFGGTYFPPTPRYGRSSLPEILQSVSQAYKNEPKAVKEYGDKIRETLQNKSLIKSEPDALNENILKASLPLLSNIWDHKGGGMSGAPKFPQAPLLSLLAHMSDEFDAPATDMLHTTLTRLAQGGIYDHIGGGFARYAVDDRWFVPHFEKMLYDNALLLGVYGDAWRKSGNNLFAKRIHETIDWLERDMLLEGGAYASSMDADSEGKEGLYYLWQKSEIAEALGDKANQFCKTYNITHEGNWREHGDGFNIPHLMQDEAADMQEQRKQLLKLRYKKIAPQRDDKILCDWNGYVISALAKTAILFDRQDYFEKATKAFTYISQNMKKTQDGTLYHCAYLGKLAQTGMLSDYASMVIAGINILSASGFFPKVTLPDNILTCIKQYSGIIRTNFWDAKASQFYMSSKIKTDMPARISEWQDNATPSSSGLACIAMAESFQLLGDSEAYDIATACLQQYAAALKQSGFATASFILAYEILHKRKQILATGKINKNHLRKLSPNLNRIFIANKNNAAALPEHMQEALTKDGNTSLYRICDKGVCNLPSSILPTIQ